MTKRSQIPLVDAQEFFSGLKSPIRFGENKPIRGDLDPSRSAQDARSDAPRGRLPNEAKIHSVDAQFCIRVTERMSRIARRPQILESLFHSRPLRSAVLNKIAVLKEHPSRITTRNPL